MAGEAYWEEVGMAPRAEEHIQGSLIKKEREYSGMVKQECTWQSWEGWCFKFFWGVLIFFLSFSEVYIKQNIEWVVRFLAEKLVTCLFILYTT